MPNILTRISLAAALASTVYSTAIAQSSSETTSKKNEAHTLFSGRWLKAIHVDMGGGSVPYLDRSANTFELRLGMAFSALPVWTFAWSANFVAPADTSELCGGPSRPFIRSSTGPLPGGTASNSGMIVTSLLELRKF